MSRITFFFLNITNLTDPNYFDLSGRIENWINQKVTFLKWHFLFENLLVIYIQEDQDLLDGTDQLYTIFRGIQTFIFTRLILC